MYNFFKKVRFHNFLDRLYANGPWIKWSFIRLFTQIFILGKKLYVTLVAYKYFFLYKLLKCYISHNTLRVYFTLQICLFTNKKCMFVSLFHVLQIIKISSKAEGDFSSTFLVTRKSRSHKYFIPIYMHMCVYIMCTFMCQSVCTCMCVCFFTFSYT